MKTPAQSPWTFFTNHGHVLVCLFTHPGIILRDVASWVGITERMTQRIVRDLVDSGIVSKHKVGRVNSYVVNARAPLRHPLEAHRTVGELLEFLLTNKK